MSLWLRISHAVLAPALLTGFMAAFALAVPAASGAKPVAVKTPPYRIVPGPVLTPKPSGWKLPVGGYRLTGEFGDSNGPWANGHTGLDFAVAEGAPILAIAPGEIVSTSYDGAYGNKTVLRLADGTEMWFCHQSAFVATPGQRVAAGQLIGYVGSTGNVTGPHLHLEVRPAGGDPVDPYATLVAKGLRA